MLSKLKLYDPLFISCCILYACSRLIRFYEVDSHYPVSNHLADLVCIPIILQLIFVLSQLIPSFRVYTSKGFPIVPAIFVTAYWSVFFEYYLPLHSTSYTADWLDVLSYWIGMLVFLFWNRYNLLRTAKV